MSSGLWWLECGSPHAGFIWYSAFTDTNAKSQQEESTKVNVKSFHYQTGSKATPRSYALHHSDEMLLSRFNPN